MKSVGHVARYSRAITPNDDDITSVIHGRSADAVNSGAAQPGGSIFPSGGLNAAAPSLRANVIPALLNRVGSPEVPVSLDTPISASEGTLTQTHLFPTASLIRGVQQNARNI